MLAERERRAAVLRQVLEPAVDAAGAAPAVMRHATHAVRGGDLLPADPRITAIQRAAADRLQRIWQAQGQRAITRAQLPDGLLRLRSSTRAVLIHPDGQVVPDTPGGRRRP